MVTNRLIPNIQSGTFALSNSAVVLYRTRVIPRSKVRPSKVKSRLRPKRVKRSKRPRPRAKTRQVTIHVVTTELKL